MTPRRRALILRSLLVALPLALSWSGCGEVVGGGDQALREALATTAGAGPGRVAPGAAVPFADADPHRMRVRASLRLDVPDAPQVLAIDRTIDRGAGGRFRIVDHRARTEGAGERLEEGREAVFDGERFASRRRFGPWVARDVLDGGHHRMLAEAYDLGRDLLGAFGDYLTFVEDPTADEAIAGLAVRWSAVELDPRVAPREMEPQELAALRDHTTHWTAWVAATHRPERVSGALARTRDGERWWVGTLEVSGTARVDGVTAAFVFEVEQVVSPVAGPEVFELPGDLLPERRPRSWRMIDQVLGPDLLPPYRPSG